MSIVEILGHLFNLFQIVFLAWILMSWIPDLRQSNLYRNLDNFFSVLLEPIRRIIPPIGGTLDISPIILMLLLQLGFQLLMKIL